MTKVQKAKKRILARYRHEEGFLGVGISRRQEGLYLRIYVVDQQVQVAKELAEEGSFDGFPVEIIVSGKMQAAQP